MVDPKITLTPITTEDAVDVGRFLHQHLNGQVQPRDWLPLLIPPWRDGSEPNHGFKLKSGDRLVGVYAAVYSTRNGHEHPVTFCNLAAFCVLEEFRSHSLRLARALLKQKGLVFTDLSPSGNVVALNEKMGFVHLTSRTRLVANHLPRPGRRLSATSDPARLASRLVGDDALVFRDHRHTPATGHLLVETPETYGYLMYRRHRFKRLPLVALPLHVGGDPETTQRAWPAISAHLWLRGLPATLVEPRLMGFSPTGPGVEIGRPRARMVRDPEGLLGDLTVDYAYSEFALVRW